MCPQVVFEYVGKYMLNEHHIRNTSEGQQLTIMCGRVANIANDVLKGIHKYLVEGAAVCVFFQCLEGRNRSVALAAVTANFYVNKINFGKQSEVATKKFRCMFKWIAKFVKPTKSLYVAIMMLNGGGMGLLGMNDFMSTGESDAKPEKPHTLAEVASFVKLFEKDGGRDWLVSDKLDGRCCRLCVVNGLALVLGVEKGDITPIMVVSLNESTGWPQSGEDKPICLNGVFDGELIQKNAEAELHDFVIFDVVSLDTVVDVYNPRPTIVTKRTFEDRLRALNSFFSFQGETTMQSSAPGVLEVCLSDQYLNKQHNDPGRVCVAVYVKQWVELRTMFDLVDSNNRYIVNDGEIIQNRHSTTSMTSGQTKKLKRKYTIDFRLSAPIDGTELHVLTCREERPSQSGKTHEKKRKNTTEESEAAPPENAAPPEDAARLVGEFAGLQADTIVECEKQGSETVTVAGDQVDVIVWRIVRVRYDKTHANVKKWRDEAVETDLSWADYTSLRILHGQIMDVVRSDEAAPVGLETNYPTITNMLTEMGTAQKNKGQWVTTKQDKSPSALHLWVSREAKRRVFHGILSCVPTIVPYKKIGSELYEIATLVDLAIGKFNDIRHYEWFAANIRKKVIDDQWQSLFIDALVDEKPYDLLTAMGLVKNKNGVDFRSLEDRLQPFFQKNELRKCAKAAAAKISSVAPLPALSILGVDIDKEQLSEAHKRTEGIVRRRQQSSLQTHLERVDFTAETFEEQMKSKFAAKEVYNKDAPVRCVTCNYGIQFAFSDSSTLNTTMANISGLLSYASKSVVCFVYSNYTDAFATSATEEDTIGHNRILTAKRCNEWTADNVYDRRYKMSIKGTAVGDTIEEFCANDKQLHIAAKTNRLVPATGLLESVMTVTQANCGYRPSEIVEYLSQFIPKDANVLTVTPSGGKKGFMSYAPKPFREGPYHDLLNQMSPEFEFVEGVDESVLRVRSLGVNQTDLETAFVGKCRANESLQKAIFGLEHIDDLDTAVHEFVNDTMLVVNALRIAAFVVEH